MQISKNLDTTSCIFPRNATIRNHNDFLERSNFLRQRASFFIDEKNPSPRRRKASKMAVYATRSVEFFSPSAYQRTKEGWRFKTGARHSIASRFGSKASQFTLISPRYLREP